MYLYKMNADPVLLIEDDDVDMEAVLVIDDDDDDDDDDDEIILYDDTVLNNDKDLNNSDVIIITDKNKNKVRKSKKSFIRCLKSNNLMDKVVKRCLSMENCSGMPRVIEKTLLPLYRDANNKYKESASFRRLLKKTYKLLVRDPDHKFLHLKTLCEELKSGRLRRKVPFVTLATNLKQSEARENIEINSSSRTMINQRRAEEKRSIIVTKNSISFGVINVTKSLEKTDIHGVVMAENSNKQKTYDTVINETVIDINASNTHITSINERSCGTINGNEKTDVINLDNSDNESVISLDHDEGRNEVIILEETTSSGKECHNSDKENKTSSGNCTIQYDDNSSIIEYDKSHDDLQYQLLIPQNHVALTFEEEVSSAPNVNEKMISNIEQQISVYKLMIAELEETEVTNNNAASPYIQCSNLKKKIVDCYKKLCTMTGSNVDLVKRREIRLHVSPGHPSGPAKMLENFLNDTIDSTGSVTFPDFNDVLQCVIKASIHDGLCWSRQQIFQEAAALFRHCGQALRKRRQKREYKDLLSLLQDKTQTEDPAENDPHLFAKLEENKLIAKVKEEEILERYVNMENHITPERVLNSRVLNPRLRNIELGPTQDSSDSDSESEIDSTSTDKSNMNITYAPSQRELSPSISNNRVCGSGETSKNNRERDCVVKTYSINNETVCNNAVSVIGESSYNNITNPNNGDGVITASANNNLVICNSPDSGTAACSKYNRTIPDNQDSDKVLVLNGSCCLNDIHNYVSCKSDNAVIQNNDLVNKLNEIQVDNVDIKKEPLDVQSMLDELGDNFECTVFDIEDPFLVIEISSDEFSDDDS